MRIFPRYGGASLLDQLCSVGNLTRAWRRVRGNIHVARRGQGGGIDAVTLHDFEADWASQMAQLAGALRDGSYRPLPARRVNVPKASGGERALAILAVRDRVAQRAMQQVLEPLFEPLFLDCSYGCRPGVGVPEAIARVARYADQGLTWAVDADIAAYFDSIDQRILLGLLRQRIDELPILHIIALWLRVGALNGDEGTVPETSPSGPLGFLRRGRAALERVLPSALTGEGANEAAEPYAGDEFGWRAMDERVLRDELAGDLWRAAMLARPVLHGARLAAPHLRRLGGQRLLLAGAVAAGAVAAGELLARRHLATGRGTPQGGPLSPLLANIYLHPFDLALTARGFRLVRFVDDFVIMCAGEEEAREGLCVAEQQLGALRLALNPEKTRVARYDTGLEFLGQTLAPRRRGPFLEQGLSSFVEAEQALLAAARGARRLDPRRRSRRAGED